jgi:hypothetical protein
MMMRALKCVTIIVMLAVFLAPWASAEDLSAKYLHGKWVIGDGSCGAKDSEFIEFRKNGTFESDRTGRPESVGFWQLDEDILTLHMVTSPAFFEDIERSLVGFKDQYNYYQIRMVLFNTEKNRLEAIAVLGKQIKRNYAVRCK